MKLLHGEQHYRPWEIPLLTMTELALALDDDFTKPRPPAGGANMSQQEIEAYQKWYQALTVKERIQMARGE